MYNAGVGVGVEPGGLILGKEGEICCCGGVEVCNGYCICGV